MKKVRFYYSIPTQVRMVPSFADAQGIILGQAAPDVFVKWIPRVVICSVLNGNELSFGYTTCSKKDNYVKKIGQQKAYDRAINKPYKTVILNDISDIKDVSKEIVDEIFEIESKRIFKLK